VTSARKSILSAVSRCSNRHEST